MEEKLKRLIDNLLTLSNQVDIEQQLRDIQDYMLRNCYLSIKGVRVDPMEVEAYYYNTNYRDLAPHCRDEQKNRFGMLYEHHGGGGFDIVLSDGEYYLSILVKGAHVGDQNHFRQVDTYNAVKQLVDTGSLSDTRKVLQYRESASVAKIYHCKRVGIGNGNADAVLNSFSCEHIVPTGSYYMNQYDGSNSKSRYFIGELLIKDSITKEQAELLSIETTGYVNHQIINRLGIA